jgi:transposase-like protein
MLLHFGAGPQWPGPRELIHPLCESDPSCWGKEDYTTMKRRRHTPEQVIRKLTEGEKLLAEGKSIEQVARHLEVTESTFHRWRNQFGGMKANDAKRLKELERENTRLKKIVADLTLDNDMLRELNRGNY